jgi:hypothetical protein
MGDTKVYEIPESLAYSLRNRPAHLFRWSWMATATQSDFNFPIGWVKSHVLLRFPHQPCALSAGWHGIDRPSEPDEFRIVMKMYRRTMLKNFLRLRNPRLDRVVDRMTPLDAVFRNVRDPNL